MDIKPGEIQEIIVETGKIVNDGKHNYTPGKTYKPFNTNTLHFVRCPVNISTELIKQGKTIYLMIIQLAKHLNCLIRTCLTLAVVRVKYLYI